MIKAVAIDDEPLALKVLKEHASKINFIHIERYFTDPLQGFEFIKQASIAAVFLDIKMHNISGIELAEFLPTNTSIIFTTAYADYAVKGFELNAIDYLLKPISFSRLLKACHKLKNVYNVNPAQQLVLVKEGNQVIRVKCSEIYYIEATGNYLKLHTSKGTFLHRETLKDFLQTVPGAIFIRTHKSYIVNTEHISRIEHFQLTVDNYKVPLSPNYKAGVWSKLGIC